LFVFAIITNGLRITKTHIFHLTHHHSREFVDYSKTTEYMIGGNIKSADLNINFGVGDLIINEAGDSILRMKGGYFDIKQNSIPGDDSKLEFNISTSTDEHIIEKIDNEGEMSISIPKHIDWYIDANIGATDADFDFSMLRTPHIKIKCGVCDFNIKLGNLSETQEIEIDCGASDISILIPEEAGCRIVSNIFLSDIDFDGFMGSNNIWKTPNYTSAKNKIEINLEGVISDLNIRRY
jgi:hypothetical protein